MEHESEPTPDPQGDHPQDKPTNWVGIVVKLIVGIIVVFVAAVALVFGACLLG